MQKPSKATPLAVLLVCALVAGCSGGAHDPASRNSSSAPLVTIGTSVPSASPVSQLPDGPVETPNPPMALRTTIDAFHANPQRPFQAFDTMSLNIADLDGDGLMEIVSLNDNNRAYVFGADGRILSEFATARLGGDQWGARDINGVAIGDLDGDGSPELVILNSAAGLSVHSLNRSASGPTLAWDLRWNATVTATRLDPGFYLTHPWYPEGSDDLGADGNPFIAHLGNGTVVLVQSDGYPGHFAYEANGTIRWYTDFWDGNGGPWAGPLTPGGPVRAVFATDGGHVVMYDASTGVIQWDFSAPEAGARPGSIPIMPTVADLRGDGNRSIFFGARVAVAPPEAAPPTSGGSGGRGGGGASTDDTTPAPPYTRGNATAPNGTRQAPPWMKEQHALYFLLDSSGHEVWRTVLPGGNPAVYMHAATVDVNLDGVQDFIVEDWNTIGHHPGNWEVTGPAVLAAIDGASGSVLWSRAIDARWSNTGIAVAPVLPGRPQVVIVPEQLGYRDGLSFIGLDGSRQGWMRLPQVVYTVTRGPVLADLDGDGLAELVLPVAAPAAGCPIVLDAGCRAGTLLVYSTAAPTGQVAFANNLLFDSLS